MVTAPRVLGVDPSLTGTGVAWPVPMVEIRVFGSPGPQGSKSPKGRLPNGRALMVESSKSVKPWRQDVSAAAQTWIAHWEHLVQVIIDGVERTSPRRVWAPLDEPLVVAMVFTWPKPKSAPKTRRTWPDRYPDVSKLARSTEDALTTAGIWRDDARIVEYARLAKVFPGEDPDALRSPGALIRVWRMADWPEVVR